LSFSGCHPEPCPELSWVVSGSQDDYVDYADQIYDLLCLRPAAFLGGIGGTAVFIIALPFTVASGGVDDSFNMLVAKPFWYAFVRKFPDENLE
jgi:hypothetical protein